MIRIVIVCLALLTPAAACPPPSSRELARHYLAVGPKDYTHCGWAVRFIPERFAEGDNALFRYEVRLRKPGAFDPIRVYTLSSSTLTWDEDSYLLEVKRIPAPPTEENK